MTAPQIAGWVIVAVLLFWAVGAYNRLVSLRTLDNWTAGRYPQNKVTGAVRDVDAWAVRNVPGYPDAAAVPRLIHSSGPRLRSRSGWSAWLDSPLSTTTSAFTGNVRPRMRTSGRRSTSRRPSVCSAW